MEFEIETCNGDDFRFFERHKSVKVEAVGVKEAMAQVNASLTGTWEIAQVSRKFTDCSLAQPVFDGMNGMMYTIESINTVDAYRDLISAEHFG